MNVRLLAILILLPLSALAQGFAGLGTTAEGFAIPQRSHEFRFPRDHGPHPDYRIEWWYVTANLQDADGTQYGIQWTLFRSALQPHETSGWQSPQLWMGHAALTTAQAHYVDERMARGGIGQAGVTAAPFKAWIDDWQMRGDDLSKVSLTANGRDFGYDLQLEARGPLVFHGDNGYSVKSRDGQASQYYSQPNYILSGQIEFADRQVAVTGTAWLDREWSSQPLSEDQSGWDWFSLGFADGNRVMAFRLRGGSGDFMSGTWIAPDGQTSALPAHGIITTPQATSAVAGRDIPTRWRLEIPDRQVDVEIRALNDKAWMDTSFPYWEGPVLVTGSHEGKGYLEMTGYE